MNKIIDIKGKFKFKNDAEKLMKDKDVVLTFERISESYIWYSSDDIGGGLSMQLFGEPKVGAIFREKMTVGELYYSFGYFNWV